MKIDRRRGVFAESAGKTTLQGGLDGEGRTVVQPDVLEHAELAFRHWLKNLESKFCQRCFQDATHPFRKGGLG